MTRQQNKEKWRADSLLARIWVLTRKRSRDGRNPVLTWDELGIPFQYYLVCDLRQRGMVAFSSSGDGKTGFYLKEAFLDMTLQELKDYRDNKK